MQEDYYRIYYKNNKERYVKYIKKYVNSPKGIKKIREYRKNNKEKLDEWRRKYEKERCKKDKTLNIRRKFLHRLRMVVKTYLQTGKIINPKIHPTYKSLKKKSFSEYERILIGYEGVDYKAIIEYLKPFPKDFLNNYQIDHIKPLHSFDFNTPKGIKECFKPENHQTLTIKENQSKGKK